MCSNKFSVFISSMALTEDSETTVLVSKLSDLTVQDREVEYRMRD